MSKKKVQKDFTPAVIGVNVLSMDKQELKNLIKNTPINSEMSISFLGELAPLSGNYKLLSTGIGRGKGGSLVAKLMNLENGETLSEVTIDSRKKTFGSSISEYIQTITLANTDGTTTIYGDPTVTDSSMIARHDHEKADILRITFDPFVGVENPFKIKIDSSEPWLAGEWQCVSVRKLRGKFRQLALQLSNGTKTIEFWTYKHSGIINDVQTDIKGHPSNPAEE